MIKSKEMDEKSIVHIDIEKVALQQFIQVVRELISVNEEYADTLNTLADTNKATIDFYAEVGSFNEDTQTIIGSLTRIINMLLPVQEDNVKEIAQSIIKRAESCSLEYNNFGKKISSVKERSINLQRCFSAYETSNENVKNNIQSLLNMLQGFEDRIPIE